MSISCYSSPLGRPPSGPDWTIAELEVAAAWALRPPPGGRPLGAGISVAHPDTGYSAHPEYGPHPGRVITADGWDFVDDVADPQDRLNTTLTNSHPGHGTSTATLIQSPPGPEIAAAGSQIDGLAPDCLLVPMRVCDSTAFVANWRLARGVLRAIAKRCDVVSISLGGLWTPGMADALREAVDTHNMVVVAAAGQCVPFVVAPASERRCIAVAGSTRERMPWSKSSSGSAVAISAPGFEVRVAEITVSPSAGPDWSIGFGSGTSFASAYVAGAAALWLAFQGAAPANAQAAFRAGLQASATVPAKWPASTYGAGILNLPRLLQPFKPPAGDAPPPLDEDDFLGRIQDLFGGHFEGDWAAESRRTLQAAFGAPDDEALQAVLRRFGPELLHIFVEHGGALLERRRERQFPDLEAFVRFLRIYGSQTLGEQLRWEEK